LSHKDNSIRIRALDVVSTVVDEQNVETIVSEVLEYIKLADSDFRVDLVQTFLELFNALFNIQVGILIQFIKF
jgi:hypothetical protein